MSKQVALVFKDSESRDHWTTNRFLRRAGGLKLSDYRVYTLSNGILDDINRSGCSVVVTIGEHALDAILGKREMIRWFNRVVDLPLNGRTVQVVPLFDPRMLLPYQLPDSSGQRQQGMRHPPRFTGMQIAALRKAEQVASGAHPPRVHTNYLEDPSPQRFRQWVDACLGSQPEFLSWDIETPYKISEDDEDEYEEEKRKMETTILRISFASQIGTAVSIPWLPEYFDDIRRLLAFRGYHIGWNSLTFDIPIVESHGFMVGGLMLDGMDLWHLLQSDLDKGIEHVTSYYTDLLPWKHLSDTLPALYSCIDADAALRNVVGILADLRSVGLFDQGIRQMKLMALLSKAGRKGNYVDDPFRLELKAELETLLFDKVMAAQGLVAAEFRRNKLYARLPKGVEASDWGVEGVAKGVTVCSLCGKERVNKRHKCPVGPQWQKAVDHQVVDYYYDKTALTKVTNLAGLLTYLKGAGFNPCSANQMKLYMKAHRHPVGTNHKTKQETADVKHIQKLVVKYGAKHPIYAHTLTIRQIQKALSTYVNGLEPDDRGLVYTTYVNSPSTWRLGSRNINVQNLGKRGINPYATKARKIIIPRPGYVFVQADSSAIEAVMVGKFMNDEDYIKLARKGVHAYVVGKYLGESFTPQTFTSGDAERVKKGNKKLYDLFKQVNHGTNFGMGPYLMHMNDPEKFPSPKDAERIQDFIFQALPGLPKWHHQLRYTAQKNTYLDNPWGLRHYFYDVFTYKYDENHKLTVGADGLPQIKLGKDGNKVIAFKPQSSAGMFMRDNLLLLGDTDLAEFMVPVVSIHDGYTVEVPDRIDMIAFAVSTLSGILTRPIAELGGLQVGCEIELLRHNFLDSEFITKVEIA